MMDGHWDDGLQPMATQYVIYDDDGNQIQGLTTLQERMQVSNMDRPNNGIDIEGYNHIGSSLCQGKYIIGLQIHQAVNNWFVYGNDNNFDINGGCPAENSVIVTGKLEPI